ncbi:uncharacterized protein [Amphiura filiformis]|uniref:uncharacterized protein n=1 Tax=Amphiura filiformis TaxID=82378 RepID=UPI003B20F23E
MDDVKLIAADENIDVFTISETWLDSTVSDNEVNVPGYQLYRRDRSAHIDEHNEDDHGGVACYVRDSLTAIHREDLNDDAIEALWVEIKPKYRKPILVCTFYRPPSSYVEYFKRFDEKVQSINADDIVILGDFNLDCLSENTYKKVHEFCTNSQLSQLVDEPTRVTETTSTLIDLICVSKPEEISNCEVVYYGVSDHYLVKMCKKYNRVKLMPKTVTIIDANNMNSTNHDCDLMSNNLGSIGSNVFRFTEITESYVLKELKSISICKSTGMDNIPANLLKVAAAYISNSLTHICNVSLKKGKVPNEWKEARVTPIHKGGDKDDLNNFRPISVLPIISKILERSVHEQLYTYIQENNILSSNQSGFRPNHSTQSTLIDVTDHILTGMEERKATGIVFLDLRKAFDTVNHDLLLKKLYGIGIRDMELTWFTSYLKERTQATAIGGTLSDQKCITIGVPQGTILGPLLFSIFVNDLSSNLTCKTVLYADDTALMYSSEILDITGFNVMPMLPEGENTFFGGYKSSTDIDAVISLGRDVYTGTGPYWPPYPYYSRLDEPGGSLAGKVTRIMLPSRIGIERIGAFYINATKGGVSHRMITITMDSNAGVLPESQTKTVYIGQNVTLTMQLVQQNPLSMLEWRFNEVLKTRWGGSPVLHIGSVTKADEGIYECYDSGQREQGRQGIMRLIVQECLPGWWNPPSCNQECPICYNGGICDAQSGQCVCPPGFGSTNCELVFGSNSWGNDGVLSCSGRQDAHGDACKGRFFCRPDPYGCSCIAGYQGLDCMTDCVQGTFGAGCTQECHCESMSCLQDTGECHPGVRCMPGWTGINCQVRDPCPDGYYGSLCTERCRCKNNWPCNQQTGYCPGGCQRGYIGEECVDDGSPKLVSFRSQEIVNSGHVTILICSVTGNPIPSTAMVTVTNSEGTEIPLNISQKSGPNVYKRENRYQVVVSTTGAEFFCNLTLSSGVTLHKSYTVTVYTPPILTNVPIINSGETTSSSVSIRWTRWDPSMGGDGPVVQYIIKYREITPDPDAPYTNSVVIMDVNILTKVVDGLHWHTEYDFVVVAVRAGVKGEGPPSPKVVVTTRCDNPPTSPNITRVYAINSTAIAVIWRLPPPETWGCKRVQDVVIKWREKDNGMFKDPVFVPASEEMTIVTLLKPCVAYEFMIRLNNIMYLSGPSSPLVSGTTGTAVPGPVLNLTASGLTSNPTQIRATWKLPTSNICPVDSYRVTYQKVEAIACAGIFIARSITVPSTEEVFVVRDLDPYSRYKIVVSALNMEGEGEETMVLAATTSAVPSAAPITSLIPPIKRTSLQFSWLQADCMKLNGPFNSYKYQLMDSNGNVLAAKLVWDMQYKYNVTFINLTPCTDYFFRVSVSTDKGFGYYSEPLNGTTATAGIERLSNTKVNPNQKTVFTCLATDNPVPSREIVILERLDGGTNGITYKSTSVTGETRSVLFDVNSVAAREKMVCRLMGTECGKQIQANTFVLPQLTQEPTIVSVNSTSVKIQWNAWNLTNGDIGDGPVIGYHIYCAESFTGIRFNGSFIPSKDQAQSVIQGTIGSLLPGTEYVIQVSTVREGLGGEGDPGPMIVVTTEPPILIAEGIEETSITLTWLKHHINETILFYQISHRAIDKPYRQNFQSTVTYSTFLMRIADDTQTDFIYVVDDDLEPSTLFEILVSPVGDSVREDLQLRLEVYTRGASDIPTPSTATVLSASDTTITITFPALESKYLVSYKFGVEKIHPITKREVPSFNDNGDAYIAASISKFEYEGRFTIGDGKVYGTYQNLPLEQGEKYNIYIGASSGFYENEVVKWSAVPLVAAVSDSRNSVISATIGSVVPVVVISIVIIIVLVILKRRRDRQNGSRQKTGKAKAEIQSCQFENETFNADDDEYEDVGLDDQGYEEITSSKLDISWDNLDLSGKLLGKGNFGEVQLARVWINDKWIKAAVKTLKDDTPVAERELFQEEFTTMVKIGYHHHVVNVLGSCEHMGTLYVVLEYVPHGNLRKFLRKSRKEADTAQQYANVLSQLAPEQLLQFGIDVARAMKHIADCGVIHRDLAARNILVGRGLAAKVADFGMSRDEDIYVQTSSRRVPTRWLSIESLTRKTYTTKSDVWSFGILLWEIATFGGTPYAGMETKHLAYNLTTEGYRMPKPDNCEQEMYELMLRCWQEDPDNRPTFSEIVDILNDMSSNDKIYMTTQYLTFNNFQHAAISLDKDDK